MNQLHSVETSAGAPLTNSADLLEWYCTGRLTRFRVDEPLVSARLRPPSGHSHPLNAERRLWMVAGIAGSIRRAAVVAVILALAGAVAGCTGSDRQQPAEAAPAPRIAGGSTGQANATFARIPDIVTKAQPSVVTIITGEGLGSGVVWSRDGVIVTNEHVVGNAKQVQVARGLHPAVAGRRLDRLRHPGGHGRQRGRPAAQERPLHPGDTVTVTYLRGGGSHEAKVQLADRPTSG
jgi:hypothetical protein